MKPRKLRTGVAGEDINRGNSGQETPESLYRYSRPNSANFAYGIPLIAHGHPSHYPLPMTSTNNNRLDL
eukprot:SAG31_NODE_17357_length_674_cov_0.801739_1_plen_68_part_01